MSLTPLVWVLLYVTAAIGAFTNPIFGLFGYLLEYFQRPAFYWWGRELPALRWNLTIALIAGAAFVLQQTSLPEFKRLTRVPVILLLLQAINTSIVTLWAVAPNLSLRWSIQYWKLVATFILFSGIVRSLRALDLVLMFQMVGAAYWGWAAIGAKRIQSRLEGIGSGDTANSNLLGAHLCTIVPSIVIYILMKGKPMWMRLIALVAAPLVVNLLVLTNSRGATLGLLGSGLAAFVLVRSGLRSRVALAGVAAVVALFLLADPEFIARQQTIAAPNDNSAQARLALWRGSMAMIVDYPFGAGGRGYHFLSPRYVPELQESNDGEGRSSHNTYIQVAVDWGLQGLALFITFVGYIFVLLHRVRRERTTTDAVYWASLAIQLGLMGTLTSAFFSNRFFGESIYWLSGLATALYQMQIDETKSVEEEIAAPRAAA